MFSLHEKTRKRICRAAFLLLCVLPTLGTLAWIAYVRRPHRERAWQEVLERRLQVQADIVDQRLPRPGEMSAASVSLRDAHQGVSLLKVESLRSRRAGRVLGLTAESASLHAEGFLALTQRVASWMAGAGSPVDLQVGRVDLRGPAIDLPGAGADDGIAWRHVAGRLAAASSADAAAVRRLELRARLADSAGEETVVKAFVERWSRNGRPLVRAQIDAGNAALPAWLLREALPGGERLLGARWSGQLQLTAVGDDLRGALTGRFHQIQLANLLPAASPHQLQGVARIQFDHLQWCGGRIEQMEGTLHAEAGAASRSLLAAAVEKLFCVEVASQISAAQALRQEATAKETVGAPTRDALAMVSFDEAALRFKLDSEGLTVWGACEGEPGVPTRVLATFEGRPVLLEPEYEQLPLGRWVQFLIAPAPSWLPASRDAVETARRLPLAQGGPSRQ